MGMSMTKNGLSALAVLALIGALSGCTTKAERVENREDLLAAAGFNVIPASSPDRRREIAGLPAHHFLSEVHGDKVIYLYADPLVCNCIYVGGQPAYDTYRQEVFQRQIATQQQVAADTLQRDTWDWGPWGPGWWVYGP
jgi:hypothetical protein